MYVHPPPRAFYKIPGKKLKKKCSSLFLTNFTCDKYLNMHFLKAFLICKFCIWKWEEGLKTIIRNLILGLTKDSPIILPILPSTFGLTVPSFLRLTFYFDNHRRDRRGRHYWVPCFASYPHPMVISWCRETEGIAEFPGKSNLEHYKWKWKKKTTFKQSLFVFFLNK